MNQSLPVLLLDAYRSRRAGPSALERRRLELLRDMAAFARANSRLYRELYRGLPEQIDGPRMLPVTTKKELMARFDEWVTDPEVTLEKARAFVENPALVGERFLGRYLLAASSGSTGARGIFVVDDGSVRAATAHSLCMFLGWLGRDVVRVAARGGRTALVVATGGHFSGIGGMARLRKSSPRRAAKLQITSVHTPLPEMVARINRFQPAILSGYASIIGLLAGEQEAGRLRIRPALVVCTSEGLNDGEFARIAKAFRAKVRAPYGATECVPLLAEGCQYHWLHLTDEWCLLEPVDADYRPVPAGVQSQTVLLSNLANRVQPILRYDLGDSVVMRPDPCPCGDPTPAIRVQGRVADVLTFPGADGGEIKVPPLVFDTFVQQLPEVQLFQIVQTDPTTLRVRLRPAAGADPTRVWQRLNEAFRGFLDEHGLDHVVVDRAAEPPELSAGGKHRTVIPFVPPTH